MISPFLRALPISDLLGTLSPTGVVFSNGEIADLSAHLWPEERAAMVRSVSKRVFEFSSGRFHARQALLQAGAKPQAIPVDLDRTPVWPPGIVGSISHSNRHCIALAAKAADFSTVAVDLEVATPLDDSLIGYVCDTEELPKPPSARALVAKYAFCAKECFYKAYYPLVRRFLEFSDVRVSIDMDRGVFHSRLDNVNCPALLGTRDVAGRIGLADGHVISLIALPRGA